MTRNKDETEAEGNDTLNTLISRSVLTFICILQFVQTSKFETQA